jgi:acetyl-CoA carboxylase carboxyltransferase component
MSWLRNANSSSADLAGLDNSNHSSIESTPTKSTDDRSLSRNPLTANAREGCVATVETLADLPRLFPLICNKIPEGLGLRTGQIHVLHIIIQRPDTSHDVTTGAVNDDEISAILSQTLQPHQHSLNSRGVRRVSFLVGYPENYPSKKGTQSQSTGSFNCGIFTYRLKDAFGEDRLYRHIEATHAFHLDIDRMSKFDLTLDAFATSTGSAYLYYAVPKAGEKSKLPRFFARLLSFTSDLNSSDTESLFVETLDHLSLTIGQGENGGYKPETGATNHVFICVIAPETVVPVEFFQDELQRMCSKFQYKLQRLSITTVEMKVACRLQAEAEPLFIRLVATNPTGFVLKIDKYFEACLPDGRVVFKTITLAGENAPLGAWDGMDISTPYEVQNQFESQRAAAMNASHTLYVYDWPTLFAHAAEQAWEPYRPQRKGTKLTKPQVTSIEVPPKSDVFVSHELVLYDTIAKEALPTGWTAKHAEELRADVIPMSRPPGLNDIGMVAWLVRLCTPEYPQGREVVIIANDITFQAGSFGTREDYYFAKASEYARKKGIPRLYLAANSGARIGMAKSLKSKFKVNWLEENDPSKGFDSLYLEKEDYLAMVESYEGDMNKMPVICSLQNVKGVERYVITDVIGEEEDLGVENLMGSGLIAGETSRAYDETFTLTLVVGRTVGIGAYLVRLGQRTIQKSRHAPIILTGYQALNKLMGRDIYTTNDQLGGPGIMFPNGVTHLLAETHLESVVSALNWLSFVPNYKGASLPIRDMMGMDSIDRIVDYCPPHNQTYDPRLLLTGVEVGSGDELYWQGGFFDKDSFVEVLAGWAKTVVTGRARLGGIPMGVIVTENRTAEAIKPADPADPSSREKMVMQAGGVWFPDSAYKTAQALKDFNREGLPCIIFANWRGFSGGQRDMFDEVLKFGSMIVDALVEFEQPLFVYIPPFAELRGGAWVVMDSTINGDVMEFYAAEDSRGGVLEATGAAVIKYRDAEVMQTAHRIDGILAQLDMALSQATGETAAEIKKQITQRERMLLGVYRQVTRFITHRFLPNLSERSRFVSHIYFLFRSLYISRIFMIHQEECVRKELFDVKFNGVTHVHFFIIV